MRRPRYGSWVVRPRSDARGFQGLGIPSVHDTHDFWERMPTPAIYQLHRAHHRITVKGPGLNG
jgi:hypothetical protein